MDVGGGHTAITDISVGFGIDRQRLNVVCSEAPGVVVLTDPAMDDELEMDELLDGNYGAGTLTENERIHYGDLKDRYRQRRDRTRQLVAQLSTLNTRQTLNPTEVRLLARTLTAEDIRKFSKFETLAAAICGQQDVIEGWQRRYDDQVASAAAELAHVKRSHEAKMAHELGQAKLHVDVANDNVKASEAHAQLLLEEQEQRSKVLIRELRRALKEITEQDGANTRASAEMEVQLRKELLEAKHRIAQLEPAWQAFLARHQEEEEAQELEQQRRAAVAAQPSEGRSRRQGNESGRVELRGVSSMPSSDAAPTSSVPATPRGRDAELSASHEPGSASTVGMFSPAASSGAGSAGDPGPSTATVDSDAARVTETNRGSQGRHVQDAMPDGTVSSSVHPLRREELLIPDSMRKTTLANLETKTLKTFRNIFAHHKNAKATISDWVSYIPVELHTQVRARIRHVVDPKTDKKRFTPAQVDKWQDLDVLTVLDVLIEPNAAEIVDGNSLVVAHLENIDLVPSEFFVSRYYETLEHQLSTIYRQFMLVYEECRHEESTPQVKAMERAFKRSSEGKRLNNMIREKEHCKMIPHNIRNRTEYS